eukprot:g410.t1
MLGYDVEFGHRQAADLISEEKYADKQVGYVACSVLLNENDMFIRIAINSVRNDLLSRNEAFQCLALSFIGNVGGAEMAEALTPDVMKLLTSGNARHVVRKKAALALLRLYRKMPVDAEMIQPSSWSSKMSSLLDENDVGLLISVCTLLLGIVSRTSSAGYEGCLPKIIGILGRMVVDKDVGQQYTYYGIPSPWLQVKSLRLLQYFPPTEDPISVTRLTDILSQSINGMGVVKNSNKSNAQHAILFEAIALCLHLDLDQELLTQSVALLGKFLTMNDPNIKYLALENMSRLALVPEMLDAIKRHQKTISSALKDADVSIRRRALDLLFTMCDTSNSVEIVDELLNYTTIADFSIREELVLKIAILAERFAPNVRWYMDSAMSLIERAGEHVSEDIWHRVIQLVTNNDDMKQYAANKVIEALQRGGAHEALISVAGFILGEYGSFVRNEFSPMELFHLLQDRFPASSMKTKGLLLTSYLKLVMMDPNNQELKNSVVQVFEYYSKVVDTELQQRAVEYLALVNQPTAVALQYIQPMPKWEGRESSLVRRLAAQEGEVADAKEEDEDQIEKTQVPGADLSIPLAVVQSAEQDSNFLDLGGDQTLAETNGVATTSAPLTGIDALDDLLSTPTTQVVAPMSSSDPFAASGAEHELIGGPPPAITPLGDLDQWFTALITKDKGVLYEDTYLQLGLHGSFNGSRGSLVLFFGNKHMSSKIEKLVCMVPPTAEFNLNLGPVPNEIQPKVQIQVQLNVECTQPFMEPPTMQLSYQLEGNYLTQTLKLPILPTKFLQPFPDISQESFFEHWKAHNDPPYKLQEFVTTPVSVPPAAVEGLLQALQFGCRPMALDANVDNAVGAAFFRFGFPGQEQQLLAQVRVEGNPQGRSQFRVTVCSPHVILTAKLKDTIMQQLSAFR